MGRELRLVILAVGGGPSTGLGEFVVDAGGLRQYLGWEVRLSVGVTEGRGA